MMLEEKIAMAQTIRGRDRFGPSARKSWQPCPVRRQRSTSR